MPQTIYDLTFCLVSKYQVVSGIAASTKIQIKAEIHHHQKIQQPKFKNNGNTSRHHTLHQITISFCLRGKMYSLTFFFRLSLLSSKGFKESSRKFFSQRSKKKEVFTFCRKRWEKIQFVIWMQDSRIRLFELKTELQKHFQTYFDKEGAKLVFLT